MIDEKIIGEFWSATEPTQAEKDKLAAFLQSQTGRAAEIRWVKDDGITQGFVLKALNKVYDNTPSGLVRGLKQTVAELDKSDQNYIPLVKQAVSDWQPKEIGRASVGKECVRRCRSRWSPYH